MAKAVDCVHPPWNPKLKRDPLRGEGVFFPSVFRKTGPGIVGTPTYAKAETGTKLLDAAADKLARVVRIFRETDLGM